MECQEQVVIFIFNITLHYGEVDGSHDRTPVHAHQKSLVKKYISRSLI